MNVKFSFVHWQIDSVETATKLCRDLVSCQNEVTNKEGARTAKALNTIPVVLPGNLLNF